MNNLSKGFRIFWIQLKREGLQLRVLSLFIIIGIFIYSYLEPVTVFSNTVNIGIAPWAFSHLTNDYICQIVFMSGAVYLFCTAPFQGENYFYTIYRSGRMWWQLGNVFYIVFMSFAYVGFILVTSMVSLLPHICFSNDWGKIWGTLAQTNAAAQFQIPFIVDSYIIGVFSPAEATTISFLLEFACVIWIGLIIYIFNFISHKPVGVIIGAFFVLLDVVISNSFSAKTFLISPVTLTQLKALSGINVQYGLTLRYAALFFGITLICLIGICLTLGTGKQKVGRKGKING